MKGRKEVRMDESKTWLDGDEGKRKDCREGVEKAGVEGGTSFESHGRVRRKGERCKE